MSSDDTPRAFISYSWSSPEHVDWVLQLANALMESGVAITLDKWDLREGHDAHAFMERMVTDDAIDKVIIVCDRAYAAKANARSGGVGTETEIVTPSVYENARQDRFVGVVRELDGDGRFAVPTYLKSRIHIDFSDDDSYAAAFDQLLRWIYDKPVYTRPKLGSRPAYLDETDRSLVLAVSSHQRRALDGIRNSKDWAHGAVAEYFKRLTDELQSVDLNPKDGAADDSLIEAIEGFLPYRNEASDLFIALGRYKNIDGRSNILHAFISDLLTISRGPKEDSDRSRVESDFLSFEIHELFLLIMTALLANEDFLTATYLLNTPYYLKHKDSGRNTITFSDIRERLDLLTYRNSRLNLRRLSLRADLLVDRQSASRGDVHDIMQADFVLLLRGCIDSLRTQNDFLSWWPETLLYAGTSSHRVETFEIFAKSISRSYFDSFKCVLGIDDVNELDSVRDAVRAQTIRLPKWDFDTVDLLGLAGFNDLATRR